MEWIFRTWQLAGQIKILSKIRFQISIKNSGARWSLTYSLQCKKNKASFKQLKKYHIIYSRFTSFRVHLFSRILPIDLAKVSQKIKLVQIRNYMHVKKCQIIYYPEAKSQISNYDTAKYPSQGRVERWWGGWVWGGGGVTPPTFLKFVGILTKYVGKVS